MSSIIETPASRRIRRFVPAVAVCWLMSGCQAGPAEGEYVRFVREVMAESAALERQAGDGPERSEHVVRSVSAWRGEEDD